MVTPRYTLLFVDDEVDVLDILTKVFAGRFEVLTASSGPEALGILQARAKSARPVDLLITDQKMPEMTGIQLVSAAREAGIDLTSILLTGYTDPEDIIAAINRGQVYRYITKPWDLNDLLITVKNAVEYTQLRRDKERLVEQMQRRLDALSVLFEVSAQSSVDGPARETTYDALVVRVLTAVSRVLPYDCGAALIAADPSGSANLRIRLHGAVDERGLLAAKEATLGAFLRHAGHALGEDRVVTRVDGQLTAQTREGGEANFASELHVPLVAGGRTVGTLSLYSREPSAYSKEDGALLETLANQTTNAVMSLRAVEERSRLRIERMVESMADGVLLTNEKNEIVVINPAARSLLKLSDDPKQLTSQYLQQTLGFYPFELVRGWEYGGAQVFREELSIFDRTVSSTVTPVHDADGTLRGVCVVLRDITEQKQLEARKDEFVSMVSHELRTPLTSINGALDLVLNFLAGEVNEKQHRYLSMAKDSADKLNAIVDDLLDLSKFAQGRLRMNFEVTHLDEIVARALEKYGPVLVEKRIRVHNDIASTSLRALADPNRLTQVFNNLFTNAVKFTPEGGEIRVEMRATTSAPGYVTLACWNSGDPIADGDLERIFERFEQARTERTRTIRGTGLGLSICRSIVEAHGGRIWAERVTHGAQFVMVLPAEPGAEVLQPDTVETAHGAVAPAGPESKAQVLVVEDEPEIAYVVKAILLSRGYQVSVAGNADDALVLARQLQPAVIVLDVKLPDVDGLHLAEILRHDPDTRHSQLLVISGTDQRERAYRQGAGAFLLKPLQSDKLLATVDALVRGRTGKKQGRVLVVDDDPTIASICEEVLRNLGFDVSSAGTLAEARRQIREQRPDLLLLDVMLPDGDGFSFVEKLKAERASSHMSVIFISARTETSSKVRALKLGGDDYLTKPFDALELGARVESVLRRREQELGSSPTTQLPGSSAIEREIQRRLTDKRPFAFCYLDLDNLKAYNDYYGFAKADGVIRQTGDLLREVVAMEGMVGDFLGHVAGDDFVLITAPESVDGICSRVVESFDRIIPLYYDRTDRERGHIEAEDRFGERRRFPVMSVSVVAVMTDGESSAGELARRAAEMKQRAKAIAGSVYLRSDREPLTRSLAG